MSKMSHFTSRSSCVCSPLHLSVAGPAYDEGVLTELCQPKGTPLVGHILKDDSPAIVPTVINHGDVINGYAGVVTFFGCGVIDFAALVLG